MPNVQNTPRVVIVVEGGLINSIHADQDMDVMIIDYDLFLESSEEGYLYDFPPEVGQQGVNRAILEAKRRTEEQAGKLKG